jgi:prephenate dehydrogenase
VCPVLFDPRSRCDVVVFSVPIPITPAVIREYTALLDPGRTAPLWMDVTSLKAPAATALREAHPRVEAVGLHPMCSPPPTNSLDGRVLVVSENGVLARWGAWFAEFLVKIGGRQVHLGALQHDKLMSLVQAGCHAGWLAQAKLWSQIVPDLGGLEQVGGCPSALFSFYIWFTRTPSPCLVSSHLISSRRVTPHTLHTACDENCSS